MWTERYREWKRKRFWSFCHKEREKMKGIYATRRKHLREREVFECERLRKFRVRLKTFLVVPYIPIFVICFIDAFNDYRLSAAIFVTYCIFAIATYLTFAFHVFKPSKRRYKELRMVRRWVEQEDR